MELNVDYLEVVRISETHIQRERETETETQTETDIL